MKQYNSQIGQDKFVDEYFNKKESGFFIEVGAHDGVTCSNTLFFEKYRNWKGICIEPGLEEFKLLCENRSSINLDCCVSNYDGESDFCYISGYSNMLSGLDEDYSREHLDRIDSEIRQHGGQVVKIKIPVFKLQTILDKYNITEVDYCSIDTEGSELKVIQSIDFNKTKFKLFSIENNYNDTQIQHYLETKGFQLLTKLRWDDIFENVSL